MNINLLIAGILLMNFTSLDSIGQEKGLVINSTGLPFISLEKKQELSLAAKQASGDPKLPGAGISFRYAANKVMPAVVQIVSTYKSGVKRIPAEIFSRPYNYLRSGRQSASGIITGRASGVILTTDGYIVTNGHVVKDAEFLEVVLNDQRSFKAQVVGVDSLTDLALLKVPGQELPFISFGSLDSVDTGDWVMAIGNPLNLTSTVTVGIISSKSRDINVEKQQVGFSFIQTDAVMNDGSSGGALVDMNGKLIGINSCILTPTGVYAGYAFSIPIPIVQKVTNDLLRFGKNLYGYLGAYLEDVPYQTGVYVDRLVKDGAAAEAGIQAGDIISKINGRPVESAGKLRDALMLQHPGDRLLLTVLRRGVEMKIYVLLGSEE